MKIATFNINDVNKRLANLLEWLTVAKPDVVCLQETKAMDAEFPNAEIEKAGYGAVWSGQKSWNGVAILARSCEPILTRLTLPGDPGDTQSRYIEAAVNGVVITSLYAPNGNPQPGPKFHYKLAWTKRLITYAAELQAARVPVVLAGDYNVVPTAQDIYPTKSYDNDALLQPETRALFRQLLDQGWVDAIRAIHPTASVYTYWDYKRTRWPRDAGLRIDHLLLSAEAAQQLESAGVDREVRGKRNASDHAPAWVVLRNPQKRAGRRLTAGTKAAAPLLAIDGDSLAHRSYHALSKAILRNGGRPAGAILGFANIMLKLYRQEKPRAILVAWDTLTAPTYRHKAFPSYQSGRDFDPELIEQLGILPEFVAACGFINAKHPGYEADDFLAAAATMEEKRGGTCLIASGDRDTFQLASERTTILFPIRAGEMARIGPDEVRERYGVDPNQVPDFIALRGDPSDRLPGLPGVGAKGAASLLQSYKTLEALLSSGRYAEWANDLRLFRSIATMNRKAPLPKLLNQRPTWEEAAALAQEWNLKQLAARLRELAKVSGGR